MNKNNWIYKYIAKTGMVTPYSILVVIFAGLIVANGRATVPELVSTVMALIGVNLFTFIHYLHTKDKKEPEKSQEEIKEMEIKRGYLKQIHKNGNVYEFSKKSENPNQEIKIILIQNPTLGIIKAIDSVITPTIGKPKQLFGKCIDNTKTELIKNEIYQLIDKNEIYCTVIFNNGDRVSYSKTRFQLITNKVVKCESKCFEFITYNKYYEIIDMTENFYFVTGDNGNMVNYHKSNFSEIK